MQLGMIGLGRMGSNMVRRLMRGGHECVVFDVEQANVSAMAGEGATGSASVAAFAAALRRPRAAWVMVPAGEITERAILELAEHFEPGDLIVDGGNTHFKDDVRRARLLRERGIEYVDVGTSGGVWGLERGYCLMIGGSAEAVRRLDPVFRALAPGKGSVPSVEGGPYDLATAEEGFVHCGPNGAGHFVKMIHNGIEYGLMQAYAEGFDILRNAASEQLPEEHRYAFDLPRIAEVWRRGSVVTSWLLDLTASALKEDPALSHYTGFVQDSGEGRWTIMAAIEEAVPADVLSASLYTRFRSRQEHTFAEKILSAMRHKFGGHVEKPVGG